MSTTPTIVHHTEILELIPHRYPFLLIDRVEDIMPRQSAVGIKAVTSTEPHLAGHFPGYPIMPGVLIIEAMAQTAGVLVALSVRDETEGRHVYFTTMDKVKFRRPVRPGDLLSLKVEATGNKGPLWKFNGIASVGDNRVASAEFSAMIVEPGR